MWSLNELMMTGSGGFPWSGGCGDVGKRAGHALGASLVVATSEGAGASEAVGGGGGRFGAKAGSARATERLGERGGVRGGGGAGRSRVGGAWKVEIEPR